MTIKKHLTAALTAAAVFAAAPAASAAVFVFRYSAEEIETPGGRDEVMHRLDKEALSFCRRLAVRAYDTAHSAGKCKRELKAEILEEIASADMIAQR